jgi:hypothetical protein
MGIGLKIGAFYGVSDAGRMDLPNQFLLRNLLCNIVLLAAASLHLSL